MSKNCFDYIVGYDTGNSPIFVRKCYCQTTSCTNVNKEISHLCKNQDTEEKEMEERFYKKVFGR